MFIPQKEKIGSPPRAGTPRRDSTPPKTQSRPQLSREGSVRNEEIRNEGRRDHLPRPEISRKKSRQDLPNIQTKLPKEIPPAFRRSASALDSPRLYDDRKTPRTPSAAASLLTPDLVHSAKIAVKDFFGYTSRDERRDKRNSAGSSISDSGPPSPASERVPNDSPRSRSRAGTADRGARPKQMVEIHNEERAERPPSRQSDYSDDHRSSKSKASRYYTSSEDGSQESDTERRYKPRPNEYYDHNGRRRTEDRHARPQLGSHRPSFNAKSQYMSSPVTLSRQSFSEQDRAETFPRDRKGRGISRPVSPMSPPESTPRPTNYLSPMEGSLNRARSRSRAGSQSRRPEPPRDQRTPTLQSSSTFPIPMPMPPPSWNDYHPSGSQTPSYNDRRPQLESRRSWQPPPFQPPSQPTRSSSDNPQPGTYRRYSEDVSTGSIAPLPSCPRTNPISGRNDWLTLPHCPPFNICPSCFNNAIAPTQFRNSFIPSPLRSSNEAISCDFGSLPWYRIAWLLLLKESHRDLRLFYGLAHVVSTAPPCLGRHEAVREWYTILDPKSNCPIRTFAVCSNCVRSVEVLLPSLKGVFIRITDQKSAPRRCDLRFDSPRFIGYFDALEVAADSASASPDGYGHKGRPVDTRALAALVKRKTATDECQQDRDLFEKRWFFIPSLPEFTVCEECFDEVILPDLNHHHNHAKEREANLAKHFHPHPQRLAKASCQLYGNRMRNVWKRVNERADWNGLVREARSRRVVEEGFKRAVEGVRRDVHGGGSAGTYANGSGNGNGNGNGVSEVWREREVERLVAEWRAWNAGS